jgi:hypothetical protein
MARFKDFDPLAAKQSLQTEVAINAMKRENRTELAQSPTPKRFAVDERRELRPQS